MRLLTTGAYVVTVFDLIRFKASMLPALAFIMMMLVLPATLSATTVPDYESMLPRYVRVVSPDAACADFAVSDSMFLADAGKIIFAVNKFTPSPTDPLLNELRNVVLPLARRRGWALAAIVMRGAASPEGPYENNVFLSEQRARAIVKSLAQSNDTLPEGVNISNMPEDYGYLLLLMQRANDPDTAIVGSMIRRYPDVKKLKTALMNHSSGQLWQRLLHQYFPELRAARIMVLFKHISPHPSVVPTLSAPTLTAIELPELHGFREMTLHRRHMIAVSTNLLEDAFYMPNFGWAPMINVGVEYFPSHGKFSFKGQFMCPYYHKWSQQRFFQIRDYHLEARYWFRPGEQHTGFFVAGYANFAKYGIGLSAKKGWQGEGFGAAVKAGYVFRLGRKYTRWRVELHAAAGFFLTRFDPYVWGNPITGTIDDKYYYDYTGPVDDFIRRNHRFSWFGPTEVGITISYDLLFRRILKRGASFRSTEKISWEI